MAHDEDPYSAPPAPSYSPPPGDGKEQLPWEKRRDLGIFEALIDTMKLVAQDPKDAFSRLRADDDYVSPLLFGLLIGWVVMAVSQAWSIGFASVLSFGDMAALSFNLVMAVVLVVIYPLLYLISVLIWVGIYHLCLMLVGGLGKSDLGFEGTYKILSYSMVAQIALVVPVIGIPIYLVAVVYFMFIGSQVVHKASEGQALLGSALPMVLCCVCVTLSVVAIVVSFSAAL